MVMHRNLGPFDTTAIGLGEMPLTIENNLGWAKGIETIHAALDAGCRHIDTAWSYYCSGGEEQTGEKLVREAMDSWKGPKDEVLIATKVGHYRNFTDGVPTWGKDGKPEHLIRYAKQSAQTLGVDTIDLLYFHRPEDTLEHCAKLGIAFVCWSPLGGFRKPKDESKFDPFREVAAAHSVSYQQVVLAWELAKGDHMFVIPGAHRPETILDSLNAGDLELTDEELAKLG